MKGFLNENEKAIFDRMDEVSNHPKYWMPFVWANTIVSRARREGRIRDDFSVKTVADSLNNFRTGCRRLLTYDQISLPLVYTQVAETLLNPFGEDDDDFNMNSMVDFNLQISYLIVDEMHNESPELIKDTYWDDVVPQELPYTLASQHLKIEPPQGSASDIVVPEKEQEFIWFSTVSEIKEENEELKEEEDTDDVMTESVNEPKNQPFLYQYLDSLKVVETKKLRLQFLKKCLENSVCPVSLIPSRYVSYDGIPFSRAAEEVLNLKINSVKNEIDFNYFKASPWCTQSSSAFILNLSDHVLDIYEKIVLGYGLSFGFSDHCDLVTQFLFNFNKF
ncbi:Bestrophin-2 [Armadillidium vulgare]|nr:Bestrophin-2 [Armadillidium vulgare]